jgi:excisionase family DNA binding protein
VTDRLMNASEVADLLSVSERWVRDATRDGRLPHVVLGRYRRYDPADLADWIEAQKSGSRRRSKPK